MTEISDTQIIDLSCLEEYTDGDPDAIRELVEVFHETASEALGLLEENICEGENTAWSDAAHKLKGASSYLGAEQLRSLCSDAQEMKTGSLEERTELYRQIEKAYANVCAALKEIDA
jgi:HPt (histidine-containing phosphotransfer) domain-containing protein